MKKFMSLVMIAVILVCTFWFSAGKTSAAGIITYTGGHFVWGKGIAFTFDASGYKNKDLKNASILVGSNYHDLHCRLNKEKNKIICVAAGGLTQYAGDTGIIYLAGQVFYVTIPGRTLPQGGSVPLSCPEGTVLGADVTFAGEGTFTRFIPGSTRAEVSNSAESWGLPILNIGNLYCNEAEIPQ